MDFIRANDGGKNLRVAGFKRFTWLASAAGITGCHTHVAAGNEDPTFLTFEFYTIGIVSTDVHGDSVGVFSSYFKIPMDGPKTGAWECRTPFYFDGASIFRAHSPMPDINMMCPPAGDHPGAKLLATQPSRPIVQVGLRMHPIQGIVDIRSTAQPHVIIKVFRHRHLLCTSPGWISRQSNMNTMKLANPTVSHQFAGAFELWPRRNGALLAANLKNYSCPMD